MWGCEPATGILPTLYSEQLCILCKFEVIVTRVFFAFISGAIRIVSIFSEFQPAQELMISNVPVPP